MLTPRVILTAIAGLAAFANGQIQLLNFTSTSGTQSACFSVLTQKINCDKQLLHVKQAGLPGVPSYFKLENLQALCVSGCSTALSTWQRRANGACANVRIPTEYGTRRLVAALVEEYVEAYNSACLKDKAGNFCNVVLGKAAGIDPVAQTSTAKADPSLGCNSCLLSVMQTQLSMPLLATDMGLHSVFAAVTSSCSSSGWTTGTPASTQWELPATTTTPPATCQGTTISVAGQSCQQVSTVNHISTMRLLAANKLSSFCYNFPTTGNLCIPSNAVCHPYTIKTGDTCVSVARGLGKTPTQIISWNPEVGADCSRIKQNVGLVICASNPGGAWIDPDPQPDPTTTSYIRPTDNIVMSPIGGLPMPTNAGWNETIEVPDFAPGTRTDCELYVQPPVLMDWLTNRYSLSCEDVAAAYNVSVTDFQSWNPSTKTNCTVMRTDSQYCAVLSYKQANSDGAGEPEPPTDYCSKFVLAESGYTCRDIAALNGAPYDQFLLWNPALGPDCENFRTGLAYCVQVYHFRQPGIVSSCNQLVAANVTDWALNPCQIIETKFGLSHARFVAWNPAVQQNCTGLHLGYDYCVSIPGFRPVFTTPSAVTARTTATPDSL